MSDAEHVAAVLRGDRESFRPLVQRYQDSLFRYAVRMVSSQTAAEDIVQDTLVSAYEKLAMCRDPDRFAAWCFQILRNRCHDYRRGPRGRIEDSAGLETLPTSLGDPVREVEQSQARSAISVALSELPPLLREAFVLFHQESVSYREMSRRLNASESALKMRVKRAREALQEALAHYEDYVPK
ncbi:MAG: sigma-70 family RNA polymerase sigma factor [Gemmatimonadota bacterium]